jgi:hypothetical protein
MERKNRACLERCKYQHKDNRVNLFHHFYALMMKLNYDQPDQVDNFFDEPLKIPDELSKSMGMQRPELSEN